MSYSSVTSILGFIPDLPQTNTMAGYTATAAIITAHITRADNLINAKISNRYDVSAFVSNPPPLLISLSEDITTFYTFRSLYSSDNQNFNEWTDKFKDAITMLTEIHDSEMDLVGSTGSVLPERTETAHIMIDSNTKNYTPAFGEDDSLDWSVDSEKLSDLTSDRK